MVMAAPLLLFAPYEDVDGDASLQLVDKAMIAELLDPRAKHGEDDLAFSTFWRRATTFFASAQLAAADMQAAQYVGSRASAPC
jgi:hypothetical protein